jgi:hypothetical protein
VAFPYKEILDLREMIQGKSVTVSLEYFAKTYDLVLFLNPLKVLLLLLEVHECRLLREDV